MYSHNHFTFYIYRLYISVTQKVYIHFVVIIYSIPQVFHQFTGIFHTHHLKTFGIISLSCVFLHPQ